MMKRIFRMLAAAVITAAALWLGTGTASAISAADCESAGGIAVKTTDGQHSCVGGTYNGLAILF